MKWIWVSILMVILSVQLSRCEHVRTERGSRQNILDALLDPAVYDPRVRPAGIQTKDSPVNVNVSIYILDIYQEDPYLKDFNLQCYFRQKWVDSRLASADPNEYVRLYDPGRIWIPDLFIINEVSSRIHDTIAHNSFIRISKNGQVLMSVRVTALLKCDTNLKFFPHDQQVCKIRIESYGHDASEILLHWDSKHHSSGINKNISHDKYVMVDFGTRKSVVRFYREGKTVDYSVLYVDLLFSRVFSPYFWNLYLPYILLVISSWGSFCIHPKRIILRVAFLFFILILMVHFSPDLHQQRNELYNVTALDFWVVSCFSFLLAAFMEYVYAYSLVVKEQGYSSELEENELEDGKLQIKENTNIPIRILKGGFLSKNYWKSALKNSLETDKICRNFAFPVIFVLLNIIYWSVCYSGQHSTLEEWSQAQN